MEKLKKKLQENPIFFIFYSRKNERRENVLFLFLVFRETVLRAERFFFFFNSNNLWVALKLLKTASLIFPWI